MSTSGSQNRFKFTESSVQKRCLSAAQEDDVVVGGTLYERRFWDTELRGFGIIARPKTASFIFQRDLHGKSVKVTIGRVGVWTVAMARARARELAVDMDRGINPNVVKRRAKARGITVKQALELHAADMKKRNCALSSIKLVEKELPMYLPDWMGRPLAELTKLDCVQRHAKLSEACGPMIAIKVLKMLGAAFRGAARVYHHLPELPPTRAIRWNRGRRRRENDVLFPGSEWVFPTRVRGGAVSQVAEVKELRGIVTEKGTPSKAGVLPSPHRLRDTFLTAAHECDVRELNIKTLANHALPGGDETDGCIRPDVEHLRVCVEKVATFLLGKAGQEDYAGESAARP
jgi:hypothetical protein